LDYDVNQTTSPDDIEELRDIYDFIIPELEKFVERKPYEPQMYYILGAVYRLGFEKLGKENLAEAETLLRQAFNYSDLRVEYFNELTKVLILENKFDEAEILTKERLEKMSTDDYLSYLIMGHLYFFAEKYEEAMEYYEKAEEEGYKFYEDDINYSRYMLTAEELGDYQKIIDTAQARLERQGPDADTFFNIAVGYLNLGEKEKAEEFFLKAVELKKEYEEYQPFFAL
jgi:tetratricopeptide (TPR) repeat protein